MLFKVLPIALGLFCTVQCIPIDTVRFFLYPDPWNPDYSQEIIPGDSKSLLHSKYNKWNFPAILIHGYGQNYSTNFPQLTKDAFLKQKVPANVILVDWSTLQTPVIQHNPLINSQASFPVAGINAEVIGRKVAGLVVFLINHGFLTDPTRVHLIGFSLGAQIAGIAGQHVKHYTGKPIQRITGLDPAGPLFQFHPIKGKRLDHSDAYFVDVIHTNQARYGYIGNSGHVDFFPNGGGPEQPGCTGRSDIPGLPGSCAHGRAWEYFTETILDSKIWACKASSYKEFALSKPYCKDKVQFGLRVPPSTRGSYFFDIVREDPVPITKVVPIVPITSNVAAVKSLLSYNYKAPYLDPLGPLY